MTLPCLPRFPPLSAAGRPRPATAAPASRHSSWRWPILAVVLGLFAHSEALAQRLTDLTIQGTGGDVELNQTFDEGRFSYTATAENAVRSLRVTADPEADHGVTYDPTGGVVDPVPVGSTTITVTVTSNTDPTETQDYRIVVRRPADTTLASLGLDFSTNDSDLHFGDDDGYLDGGALEPTFDSETRNYEAIVTVGATEVEVTATTTSPTAEITWDRGDPGSPHTRNLGTGLNTITATVKDGTSTRNYTIRVTKSDFPGAPRSLNATVRRGVGKEVTLSWSVPSDDGDAPILGYEFAHYDEIQLEANDG